MADRYVYSGAGGAGTGLDWANAFLSLALCIAGGLAAGDRVWVHHAHAESTAGPVSLAFPGTAAAPNQVLCVNGAVASGFGASDLRTTATVSTTGIGNALSLASGHAYFYGITFSSGSGATNSLMSVGTGDNSSMKFENCALKKAGTTSATGSVTLGCATANKRSKVHLVNTQLGFGSTGDQVTLRGRVIWEDTPVPIVGAVVPSTFFGAGNTPSHGSIVIRRVDFSAYAGTLVGSLATAREFYFEDCKFNATLNITGLLDGGAEVFITRCDDGTETYRHEKHTGLGSQSIETTIVRSGGASDGVTPIAWKIVTSADAKPQTPFESEPIPVWNSVVGVSRTATIQGIWGDGVLPTNAEVWVEAYYLGTAGSPIGSRISDGLATILSPAAAQAAGSGTWGGSTTKFALGVTFTPQLVGYIVLVVKVGVPSKTLYVDPKAALS